MLPQLKCMALRIHCHIRRALARIAMAKEN
jgi:hypothetical protein